MYHTLLAITADCKPCKTNLRTSNESILQYIFCRQRCSCLAELHGFFCGPRDQNVERNAWSSISVRNNIQSIQNLFENDGTKKTVGVSSFSIIFDEYLGFYYALTVTYPLDSTVHGFSHVMIHVLPWSTGSVSFVLPLPRLRSECSMRQCLLGGSWLMMGRWCLDLVWNPRAECVS